MVIRPFNVDELAKHFAQAKPFPFVKIDNFLDRDFAREVAAAMPSFQQANRWGKRFETVNERRKVQLTDTRRFTPPLRRLQEALHSPEFLQVLSGITGIPNLLVDQRMLGGGLHQTGAGGRLDVHVDFNYLPDVRLFRRLNLLLYLNPDWEESWGGELELWDRDIKVCHHSLAPILGRCVIFEINSHSFHGTTRVSCPPRITRDSIALYYYTREAPPEFADDFHGTVFRARPSEFLKGNVLMPVEAMARKLSYHAQRLVQSVKGMIGRVAATTNGGAIRGAIQPPVEGRTETTRAKAG